LLIVHAADVHLGKRQYGLKEREEDFYKAFEDLVEATIREKADALVIAGDLFDTPVPDSTMKPFKVAVEGVRRLRENGIEVIMVAGDHDIPKVRGYPAIAYLSELTGAKLLRGELGAKGYELKGFTFYGDDAVTPSKRGPLERLRAVKPKKNSVLLLHVGLCRALPFSCVDEGLLPKGYKYYALGHVHKPTVLEVHGAPAAYPGSLEATTVDEVLWESSDNPLLRRGPLLVDLGGDEAQIVGKLNVYNRKQIIKKYELPKDYKRALAEAESVPQGAVVHLYLTGKVGKDAVRAISSKFQARALTVRVNFLAEEEEEVEETVTNFTGLEDLIIEFYGKELGRLLYELVKAAQERRSDELKRVAEEIFESGAWRRAQRASSQRGRRR